MSYNQPKPGRPDRLALDKHWTAEDNPIGLVGWSMVGKPEGSKSAGRHGDDSSDNG